MERPDICAACGNVASPAHSCRMCGAIVCAEHYNKETGTCFRCLSRKTLGK